MTNDIEDLHAEIENLTKLKAQVDRGIDLQAKEIDRREKVILEKDLEINKLNFLLKRYKNYFNILASTYIIYLIIEALLR